MMKQLVKFLFTFLLILLVAGCAAPAEPAQPVTPTPVRLTPYYTATVTLTPTVAPTLKPTETLVPTITLTPQIYEVKKWDTFFDIAARHGLTTEELMAANPEVSAYSLLPGTKLVIPPKGFIAVGTPSAPTPTPPALDVLPARCSPSLTGGLHCFAVVEDNLDDDFVNLIGEFQVAAGGETSTLVTFLALTRLVQGDALPFYAYFAPPVPDGAVVSFRLLSALPVNADNFGVYPMQTSELTLELTTGGKSAQVSGTVRFEGIGDPAQVVRLLAVAYDAQGNVVGMRRYEEQAKLEAAQDFEFKILVDSTGAEIERVEVFGEAQP